jgi:BRCT domain type II-containing protein
MASEKVIGMMVEKGSPYSLEQLQGMEDRECWRWIYTHFPPKSKRPDASTYAICFTGFRPDDRVRLEKLAEQAGYRVLTGVSARLKVLVTGGAPGPSKLEKARQQGVTILSEAEFLAKISVNPKGQP